MPILIFHTLVIKLKHQSCYKWCILVVHWTLWTICIDFLLLLANGYENGNLLLLSMKISTTGLGSVKPLILVSNLVVQLIPFSPKIWHCHFKGTETFSLPIMVHIAQVKVVKTIIWCLIKYCWMYKMSEVKLLPVLLIVKHILVLEKLNLCSFAMKYHIIMKFLPRLEISAQKE